ncbi:hypothetical protein GUITHDRAFT_150317, partial [Guillardia theta CCMP2712]
MASLQEEGLQVRIFPRRKAFQDSKPYKGKALMVDISTLQPLFGLPQEEASKLLGISVTAMKQLCRKLGVGRWPYQKPSHKEMVNIKTDKTSEPLEDVSEICSFSSEEVDVLPLPTDALIFELQPSISTQPGWDSEEATESGSEFLNV